MKELIDAIDKMTKDELIKVVVSNKVKRDEKYNKIVFILKEKNNKKYYQIEQYTDKQVFHINIDYEEINEKLIEYLSFNFKQADAWSNDNNYDLKISKKGKVFLGKKSSNNTKLINLNHNKEKNYILKEGMDIKPLVDLGIFTHDGKVVNSMYDKYKQINRFIEIIDDEIKKKEYKELTVIDFGCGKSYLTFVLYYYFTKIKNINVKMIGLDLKEDVINKCNKIAKEYGYDNLVFELGDINGYKYKDKVDMVITLHACDTATDYALYNAIQWNTNMIFSVPCCQHELNKQIKSEKLSIINKYGIIKERTAALMTDAIRGNLLECLGYKTQIMEFIDMVHSPKNILIRATKANISEDKKQKSLKEVQELIKEFNLEPTLYTLLKDSLA